MSLWGNPVTLGGTGGTANIQALSVMQNGTYTASGDVDGYSPVSVNVSGGGSTNVLSGTAAPSTTQGSNGDIYLQYEDDSAQLPSGYTRVEYIENSAQGAYIDTGYLFKANSSIEMLVNESSGASYPSPFGCRTNTTGSGANQWYFSSGSSTGTGVYYAMGGNERYTSAAWSYNERHKIVAKAGQAAIDKNTIIYTNAQSGVGTVSLYLFAVNLNGSPWTSTWAVMKLYSCKIFEGDTLVMNFVPVKRDSDDVVGLYETIGSEFYTNGGSGTFVGGQASEGTPITNTYAKVSGVWQPLIGTDISDINLGA